MNPQYTLKQKMIAVGIFFAIIAFIAIIWTVAEDISNNEEEEDTSVPTEKEIVEFVYYYKGKDNQGKNIGQTLAVVANVAYPNEDILKNPSTVIDWYAIEDFTKERGIYRVGFILETYRENLEYIWYVDTNTNKIFPGNDGAKSVLDIVDSFD